MTRMIILNRIPIMQIRNKNKFNQIWIGNITLIYSDLSLWKIMDKNLVGMELKMDKNLVDINPTLRLTQVTHQRNEKRIYKKG